MNHGESVRGQGPGEMAVGRGLKEGQVGGLGGKGGEGEIGGCDLGGGVGAAHGQSPRGGASTEVKNGVDLVMMRQGAGVEVIVEG